MMFDDVWKLCTFSKFYKLFRSSKEAINTQSNNIYSNISNILISNHVSDIECQTFFFFFAQVLSKGTLFKNSGRFPRGGSQKRKSNNGDKHGHGQEKTRPSTLC